MSEAHKDEQDRWRELHDLLGLPPEGAGSAAPPAAKPQKPAPVSQPQVFRDEPIHEESAEASAPDESPELAIVNDEAIAPPLDDEDFPPSLGDEEPAPPRSAEPEEDDRHRRGRRRGRRGRGPRSPRDDVRGPVELRGPEPLDTDDTEVEPTGEEQLAPVAARAPRNDEGPRRPRRAGGRGRGRRDERDMAEEAPAGGDEVVRRKPPVEDDDDDEPMETFADWNVPSWPEIVASLYRPDR